MTTPRKSSSLEKIGGTGVIVLLAAFALYGGLTALLTGEFSTFGARGNPSKLQHYSGLKAYLSGSFLVAVGATLLLVPWIDIFQSRLLRAILVMDGVLFVLTVGSYAWFRA
jgi:ABC-type phosphate transport system permease subunit